MPAPLIGITTSVSPDTERRDAVPRAHLNRAYVSAVQGAGGAPVLLPPYLDGAALDALWGRLDGLVLSGGGDVAPARFGEAPHPTVDGVSEARDLLELELADRAVAEGLPLLAICRGVQVLNVALGGSLIQDIASQTSSSIAHTQAAPRHEPTHQVKVTVEGTTLGAVVDAAELPVNSFHHQALKRLGRGLRDVAWASDGVVEGVDLPGARGLVLGVQWHPEDLVGHDAAARRLFQALVAAARTR